MRNSELKTLSHKPDSELNSFEADALNERLANRSGFVVDPEISRKFARRISQAHDAVVHAPVKSTKSILGNVYDKLNNSIAKLDDGENEGSAKTKHLGLTALGAGFFVFAAKGTLEFLRDLISDNKKKPTIIMKFIDTAFKWAMGLGIWNTVTNKPGKFQFGKTKHIVWGTFWSFLISQLNGFKYGRNNAVASISKLLPGGQQLLSDVTDVNLLPRGNNAGGSDLIDAASVINDPRYK